MRVRIRHLYERKKTSVPGKGGARFTFLLTGGGTGGHVFPAIAVARELRRRGHAAFFVGTREGLESKLVPPENIPLEFIEIGGLKRVGWKQTLRTVWQLPAAVAQSMRLIRRYRPAAVFSMGGYVAGPATLAAWILRRPVVLMEPNAMPGMANRYMAKIAARACLSFPEAREYFPADRIEMTGLPVRSRFFEIPKKTPGGKLTVLVTGGSRGSRRLNDAGEASWRLFRANQVAIRWIHQTGSQDYARLAEAFRELGCDGQVTPFIENMPRAFAQSDLVVCRSGAGAVAELAAAGKPSILTPYPFAADEHQLRNAEAMSKAGAARLVLDREMTGEELFHTVRSLAEAPGALERMGEAARQFARPGAARRAAEILEEEASGGRRKRS